MAGHEELCEVVRSIPSGRCASYGAVGRAMRNPASGRMVGRWMASSPPDIPWWRVVNRLGELPIWKLDPNLERRQRELLEGEGVDFVGDRIDMDRFSFEP